MRVDEVLRFWSIAKTLSALCVSMVSTTDQKSARA